MVAHKREALGDVTRIDLWLREVSRKVAAAHRRRGFRQHEVAVTDGDETPDENAPLQSTVLETREDEQRLYRAVGALDEEARDLIAMHELGGLPIVEIAQLVARDRKTVRKRIEAANRRLTRLFQDNSAAGAGLMGAPHALPTAAPPERVTTGDLLLLGDTGDVAIGRCGPVLIADWVGPPTIEALSLLDRNLHETAHECGTGLVYLAIVESTTNTPSLEARKKISSMLHQHSATFGVYPHVLLGGFSWIARPIMAGLAFLSGIPLPMPFFGSIERASTWLTHGYLRESRIDAAQLNRAVAELRAHASSTCRTLRASESGVSGF